MPLFNYTARDSRGQIVHGQEEGVTRYDALAAVHALGLVVTAMDETGIRGVLPGAPRHGRLRAMMARRVTLSDRALFCRQLSISVSSGIPLRESLENIMTDIDHERFRAVLKRVLHRLTDGSPFSQAVAEEPQVFDPLFLALIRAAEESGSMSETLEYLANTLEKSERLARKVKSMMAYPMFVVGFFFIVCGIMTISVMPRFQEIFASYQHGLPPLTRVVLGINQFLLSNAVSVGLALGSILLLSVALVRTPRGRLQVDRLLLKLPFFGMLIQKTAVSRFCRNLGMMLRGGVPAASAIEIAAALLGNKAMEITLKTTHDRIMAGNDIASSLDPEVFPRLAMRMVAVGEASGRLPTVLEKVSDVYDDQIEGSILMATSLFEPIIISVFGGFILVFVLAIYMPVFSVAAYAR